MSPRLALALSFGVLVAAPLAASLAQAPATGGQGGAIAQAPADLQAVFGQKQAFALSSIMERTPRFDGAFHPEDWDLVLADAPGVETQVAAGTAPAGTAPAATTTGTSAGGAGTAGGPTGTSAGATGTGATGPGTTGAGTTGVGTAGGATGIGAQQAGTPAASAPATAAPTGKYLAWEPGKLYVGAVVPAGDDLLVSIDGHADGFLIGEDNLELRVSPATGVRARLLDAKNAQGPTWIDGSGFAQAATFAKVDLGGGATFVEVAIVDPGYGVAPSALGGKLALRLDDVPSSAADPAPFLPRLTTQVALVDQRASGLPGGIAATIDARGRSAMPGESTSVDWSFTGSSELHPKSFAIGGEGDFADQLSFLRVPFPPFSPKGTATIAYPTRVADAAQPGYRVLEGVLRGDGWAPATVEAAFRVAPAIDFVGGPKVLRSSDRAQRVTCATSLLSNTDARIDGNFQVDPPKGWKVLDGTDKSFYIYSKRGRADRQFVLEAPAGARGAFEATMHVVFLGAVVDQPYWILLR